MNQMLANKIQALIEEEINPQLALHGGEVRFVKVTPEGAVHLQFQGGCRGCARARETLEEGILTLLQDRCPEVSAVVDVTDHRDTSSAYFS